MKIKTYRVVNRIWL